MRFVVWIALIVVGGCGGGSLSTIRPPTPAELATLEQKANLQLPGNAQVIAYCLERGSDEALWLHCMMPRDQLPTFLDSSPFAGVALRANDPFCLSHFDRFIATPPAKYRGAQQRLPNACALNIAIDESDGDRVAVYLMWHET